MADETKKFMSADNLLYVWQKMKTLLGEKVDKENGKGLSSNDFTSAEKTKLAGIDADADVNVLEGIKVNGTTVTPTNKIVNLDLSGYGASLSYNSTTGVITLENKSGTTLSTIDLPIESVVVSGSYDKTTKEVVLTLQNGTEIKFSVADLVSGLVNTETLEDYVDKSSEQEITGLKTLTEGLKFGSGGLHSGKYNSPFMLKGGTYIQPDLNELDESGIYYCQAGSNLPSWGSLSKEYTLMVFESAETDTSGTSHPYITQFTINKSQCWIRKKRTSSTTWDNWEIFGEPEELTNAEINAIFNKYEVNLWLNS